MFKHPHKIARKIRKKRAMYLKIALLPMHQQNLIQKKTVKKIIPSMQQKSAKHARLSQHKKTIKINKALLFQ